MAVMRVMLVNARYNSFLKSKIALAILNMTISISGCGNENHNVIEPTLKRFIAITISE